MKRQLARFSAALATALSQPSAAVAPVFADAPPNLPGNNLTSALLEYQPGGKTETRRRSAKS